jgi:hypothetical protein
VAKKPAPVVPVPKVTAVGSEAAYLRYLPLAEKLPVAEVLPYRFDAVLAAHNVQLGLTALGPHRALLLKALPLLDHAAMFDTLALAEAVVFAALAVEGKAQSLGETRVLLGEASKLRQLLLGMADSLVAAEIFKAAAVDKIRAGRGPIDTARDCIELAALYGKHPQAMKEQRLVRPEHVQRASELGTLLLHRLKPGGGRKKEPARADATAVTARDRLASLLWQRYRDVRRAAFYLWGDDLDTHVPPLQSRQKPRTKKPAAPEPAPT